MERLNFNYLKNKFKYKIIKRQKNLCILFSFSFPAENKILGF